MLPERRRDSLPRGKIHRAESTFHGIPRTPGFIPLAAFGFVQLVF